MPESSTHHVPARPVPAHPVQAHPVHDRQAALRPSAAFVGVSWLALLTGGLGYLVGLWNARMSMAEKGFYLTVLLFGLFAAVSLQKSVRDRLEGLVVSSIYHGLCWVGAGAAVVLLTVGLWNAPLARSEKGFYAMAYTLSMFAAIAVQKNVRDLAATADTTSVDLPLDPFGAPAL